MWGKKSSYLCMFGLADYFRQSTISDVTGYFVLMFDESLNKKMQEKQMDIHVRYWDNLQHVVVTRYLGSQFMGHAKADDLLKAIKEEILGQLNVRDMLQISMDGPAVNLKLLNIFQEEINNDFGHSLIDIGSCGLHSLHNAFKLGVSEAKWDISSVLSSMYNLFLNDAPARREDFIQCSGSDAKLPLKFVNHRWLKNVPVCKRAILIWPYVIDYVKGVKAKKYSKPSCRSYDVLEQAVQDQFIYAKFEFFCLIANILQPFLSNFQSEKPLVPFLSVELAGLIRNLMRRFVKSNVLDQADTAGKLVKIVISDTENHLSYKKIDVGLAADERLKDVKASDRQLMEFKMQCKAFLIGVLKKIIEKSPLKFSFVRNMACLDPRLMAKEKTKCNEKMKRLCAYLVSIKRLSSAKADDVLQAFASFLDYIPSMDISDFTSFRPFICGLDSFFYDKMSTQTQFSELFKVLQMLLILSHGQASVERGFSINKKVEVENLSHKGLVAQRIICDYVKQVGGVLKVPITNKLLISAASARQKYEAYLQAEKEKTLSLQQQRKRKAVMDEIELLKKKKKQTETDIEHLESRADSLCDKAELTVKLQFVAEANAARRKAREKKSLLSEIVNDLDKSIDEMKK